MSDSVEHPSHYNAGGVETIEGIRAALGDGFLDYCLGNVLKYVWRCKHKGKLLEDLRKAAKYLEWAIEAAESNCPETPDSSRDKPLAIPEGWRELEPDEVPKTGDEVDIDGQWIDLLSDCNVESRYYSRRIIRKIETPKPEPLAIPEGWRELEPDEMPKVTDLYENEGVWRNRINDSSIEYARYEIRHIRKIETANTSETSNSSIPDPGPGYRLLSKDPPEQVIRGDEFWQNFNREWVESENFFHEGGPQVSELYYRRKIEDAS